MPDEVTGQMMQIMLSQYVGNSAGYVFQQAEKLHGFLYDKVPTFFPQPEAPAFTLTPQRQDLPSWSPIRLNTNSWARACALFSI